MFAFTISKYNTETKWLKNNFQNQCPFLSQEKYLDIEGILLTEKTTFSAKFYCHEIRGNLENSSLIDTIYCALPSYVNRWQVIYL